MSNKKKKLSRQPYQTQPQLYNKTGIWVEGIIRNIVGYKRYENKSKSKIALTKSLKCFMEPEGVFINN